MTNLEKITMVQNAKQLRKQIDNKELHGDELIKALTYIAITKTITETYKI